MSRISSLAPETERPALGALGERRRRGVLSPDQALALVSVPLVISAGVHALFFLAYWLPELGVGTHRVLLGQLALLASKELTSASAPLVAAQSGHSGLPAAYLLLAALVLPALARSRQWLVRLALWLVTWLALVCGVVLVVSAAVRGELAASLLGVVLLGGWLAAAMITTWRSLWVEVDRLPRRSFRVGWLLAAYAGLGLLPVAVGRALFAPELRSAAASVQDSGFGLAWSALGTWATLPLCVAGVLVGVVLTLAHRLVPTALTRRPRRTGTVLLAAVVCLGLVGAWAAAAGSRRAEQLLTESPAPAVADSCGSWIDRSVRPAASVLVSGPTCHRASAFVGYRQLASRELLGSLSPIRTATPEGREVSAQVVAARYGPTLVVATSNRRDDRPDELVGVRLADLGELWTFHCPGDRAFRLRFAGADGGDEPAAGRLTGPTESSQVVVGCDAGLTRLNPQTGRPA